MNCGNHNEVWVSWNIYVFFLRYDHLLVLTEMLVVGVLFRLLLGGMLFVPSTSVCLMKRNWIVKFSFLILLNLLFTEIKLEALNRFVSVFGSLCIKHPNLFGKSEKLDVLWDKGLCDSNVLITYRKPRPEWLSQHAFIIQVSTFFFMDFWMLKSHFLINYLVILVAIPHVVFLSWNFSFR